MNPYQSPHTSSQTPQPFQWKEWHALFLFSLGIPLIGTLAGLLLVKNLPQFAVGVTFGLAFFLGGSCATIICQVKQNTQTKADEEYKYHDSGEPDDH